MNLDTILKEADKEFDSLWDRFDMDKPHNIKYFLHSQITKAYKAGKEDEAQIIYAEVRGFDSGIHALYPLKDLYEKEIKQRTLKQIEEGLPKEKHFKNLTSEERLTAAINGRTIESKSEIKGYNKAIKDLKKFINTLWQN